MVLKVYDSFPFSVALSWKGSSSDSQNGAADKQHTTVVFPKGNPVPSTKALTFYRSGTFSVDVIYAEQDDLQAATLISTYTVSDLIPIHEFLLGLEIHVLVFRIYNHNPHRMFMAIIISLKQIGPFQSTKGDCAKIKVKVHLNLHGIVSVESATVSSLWNTLHYVNCSICMMFA